ncbi:hypothetical protein [Leptospirillum ferriphilum]|uniref:hypothetical protein n=1 Tax=Leptospirillum ferriphilum TaxID=178606 RepID=UPI0002D384AE
MKLTQYFLSMRNRPDRATIELQWIERVIQYPVRETVQEDGRIRRWGLVAEEKKYLRVILLPDGETVHNAFFDRGFRL